MVGAELKRIRQNKGLFANFVADRIGVSKPFYCKIEQGYMPTPELLFKICDVLEIDFEDIEPLVVEALYFKWRKLNGKGIT
jgi:transcriptional regulator with XRE-family HTH domain